MLIEVLDGLEENYLRTFFRVSHVVSLLEFFLH